MSDPMDRVWKFIQGDPDWFVPYESRKDVGSQRSLHGDRPPRSVYHTSYTNPNGVIKSDKHNTMFWPEDWVPTWVNVDPETGEPSNEWRLYDRNTLLDPTDFPGSFLSPAEYRHSVGPFSVRRHDIGLRPAPKDPVVADSSDIVSDTPWQYRVNAPLAPDPPLAEFGQGPSWYGPDEFSGFARGYNQDIETNPYRVTRPWDWASGPKRVRGTYGYEHDKIDASDLIDMRPEFLTLNDWGPKTEPYHELMGMMGSNRNLYGFPLDAPYRGKVPFELHPEYYEEYPTFVSGLYNNRTIRGSSVLPSMMGEGIIAGAKAYPKALGAAGLINTLLALGAYGPGPVLQGAMEGAVDLTIPASWPFREEISPGEIDRSAQAYNSVLNPVEWVKQGAQAAWKMGQDAGHTPLPYYNHPYPK